MASRRQFLRAGLAAAITAKAARPATPIKHVIVLMLENRSFDHMLAFSGIPGTELPAGLAERDSTGQLVPPTPTGVIAGTEGVDPDPDHDFAPVMRQMYGQPVYDPGATPTMDHFVRAYESTCQAAKDHGDNDWNTDQIRLHSHNIMKCQPPENVPVLTTLARNYALCTNWFSSIPGPTLPNRLFAHLGTSVGRLDLSALDFEVPLTLYEVLDTSGISSTIYAGGWSVAATFARLMEHQDQYFGTLDDFYQDCADNDLPGYCFVEPRYGSEVVDDVFLPQNDQHPDSDLSAGDELIHSVYQAIQSRREIWESSVLIITYDEHGGIYDHRVPPAACAPDEHGSVDPKFDFTRYGVRVPAVVVSPYTPRGRLITEVCDHTSLIACARKLLTGAWDGSQYRITADQKLGRRAQRAYPLDKAFEFLQPKRPAGDVPIQFQPVRHSKMQPRPMNHLQSSLLNLAHSVNRGLPSHLQVKTPKTIETDQEVQHFLSHVYARAARFPTTKGRKS